jgi:hypothetical protein
MKIDNFASKTEQTSDYRRIGVNAGLLEELDGIEALARHLREEAAAAMEKANVAIAETEAETSI